MLYDCLLSVFRTFFYWVMNGRGDSIPSFLTVPIILCVARVRWVFELWDCLVSHVSNVQWLLGLVYVSRFLESTSRSAASWRSCVGLVFLFEGCCIRKAVWFWFWFLSQVGILFSNSKWAPPTKIIEPWPLDLVIGVSMVWWWTRKLNMWWLLWPHVMSA